MFRSTRRPLVFTQADHARFAAAIALNWRERPPLPFESFVRGVADHDRGYGEHDDAEIGVVDNARWVEIQRAGFRPVATMLSTTSSSRCTSAACSLRPKTSSKRRHSPIST
jgi:hypothetical protein